MRFMPLDCSSCKLGEICQYLGFISCLFPNNLLNSLYSGLQTKFAGSIALHFAGLHYDFNYAVHLVLRSTNCLFSLLP